MRCSVRLRLELIAEVANRLKTVSENKLQRLLFFIQHTKGLIKPYLYDFYFLDLEGPHCIDFNIDVLEASLKDLIMIEDTTIQSIKSFNNSIFLQEIKESIDLVVDAFGEADETFLDFCSKIIYIDNHIDEFAMARDISSRRDFIDYILSNYDSYSKNKLNASIDYLIKYNFLESKKYE